MIFSQALLNNQIFRSEWLRFDETPPARNNAVFEEAAQLQPNGDYIFRFYAPNAKKMSVQIGFETLVDEKVAIMVECERNWKGQFSCVMPYDETKTGHRHINVFVDDVQVVWPYLPVCWGGSRVTNYVEVPDPDLTFSYVYDVPHGAVRQEIYWSKARNRMERCVVYTPPGYETSNEEYPVLYLLHGGGENETVWVSSFRANYIMDNLIAAGECVPFIIVMNAGMIRYPDTPEYYIGNGGNGRDSFRDTCLEDQIVESCIPFIESKYRVKKDKFMRALMGESMGCQQACDIAFHHPEIFGNFGACSSAFYHETVFSLYERPWKKALADREKFLRDWKVFYSSYTPQEDHTEYCEKDRELLREAGLADAECMHLMPPHPARYTRNASWRTALRDYAKLLFRD